MYKKIIISALVYSLLISACTSWEIVQKPELGSTVKITTKQNNVYEMQTWFDKDGYIIGDAGETLREGRFTKKLHTKVNKNDIAKYEVRSFDALKTTIFIGGTIFAIMIIMAITIEPLGDKPLLK